MVIAWVGVQPILMQLRGGGQTRSMIIWSMVLMGIVVVGLVIVLRVKAWLTEQQAGTSNKAGFTLSDLRRMLKEGQMSQEEYDKARAAIIGISGAGAAGGGKATDSKGGPDAGSGGAAPPVPPKPL